MQNSVTDSYAVCARIQSPDKFLARWHPVPWDRGVAEP